MLHPADLLLQVLDHKCHLGGMEHTTLRSPNQITQQGVNFYPTLIMADMISGIHKNAEWTCRSKDPEGFCSKTSRVDLMVHGTSDSGDTDYIKVVHVHTWQKGPPEDAASATTLNQHPYSSNHTWLSNIPSPKMLQQLRMLREVGRVKVGVVCW